MKINDKKIVAFFVAAGVFSLSQSAQYVSKLSVNEKAKFAKTIGVATDAIVACSDMKIDTDPGSGSRG